MTRWYAMKFPHQRNRRQQLSISTTQLSISPVIVFVEFQHLNDILLTLTLVISFHLLEDTTSRMSRHFFDDLHGEFVISQHVHARFDRGVRSLPQDLAFQLVQICSKKKIKNMLREGSGKSPSTITASIRTVEARSYQTVRSLLLPAFTTSFLLHVNQTIVLISCNKMWRAKTFKNLPKNRRYTQKGLGCTRSRGHEQLFVFSYNLPLSMT